MMESGLRREEKQNLLNYLKDLHHIEIKFWKSHSNAYSWKKTEHKHSWWTLPTFSFLTFPVAPRSSTVPDQSAVKYCVPLPYSSIEEWEQYIVFHMCTQLMNTTFLERSARQNYRLCLHSGTQAGCLWQIGEERGAHHLHPHLYFT